MTVRWLLGDLLAVKNACVAKKRLPRFRDLFPEVDGYDDVHADDPCPLAAELALSVIKAVRVSISPRKPSSSREF